MSAPESLEDVYADELKDLWSANDQMARVLLEIAGKATDEKLKTTLETSIAGIKRHSETIKGLIAKVDDEVKPEHCKGMAGLVSEAKKHTTAESPSRPELLDIVIMAQYQRMCHYGLAGFGTATTYAKALGMKEHETVLKEIVADIYKADEFATKLTEKTSKVAQK